MVDIKSVYFGFFDKNSSTHKGQEMSPRIRPTFSIENGDLWLQHRVLEWQEMRIDLVLISMYGEIPNAMDAIDIILAINGIDNPLNIKAGMILIYPNNIDNIDDFRYQDQSIKEERQNPLELLGKANKSTRVDEKRKAFVQNGYSLPPTVNKNPISPVRVESGNFIAGGVK